MKIVFGVRRLGAKSSDDEERPRFIGSSDDEPGGDDRDKDKESKQQRDDLTDASAAVALRAFCKALGISPAQVDTQRATKAMRALIATCDRDEDDDGSSDDEGDGY